MESEATSIKKTALKYSWYLRGGASYEDILNMSADERKAIGEIIDENLETTKKTGLNYF